MRTFYNITTNRYAAPLADNEVPVANWKRKTKYEEGMVITYIWLFE